MFCMKDDIWILLLVFLFNGQGVWNVVQDFQFKFKLSVMVFITLTLMILWKDLKYPVYWCEMLIASLGIKQHIHITKGKFVIEIPMINYKNHEQIYSQKDKWDQMYCMYVFINDIIEPRFISARWYAWVNLCRITIYICIWKFAYIYICNLLIVVDEIRYILWE